MTSINLQSATTYPPKMWKTSPPFHPINSLLCKAVYTVSSYFFQTYLVLQTT